MQEELNEVELRDNLGYYETDNIVDRKNFFFFLLIINVIFFFFLYVGVNNL